MSSGRVSSSSITEMELDTGQDNTPQQPGRRDLEIEDWDQSTGYKDEIQPKGNKDGDQSTGPIASPILTCSQTSLNTVEDTGIKPKDIFVNQQTELDPKPESHKSHGSIELSQYNDTNEINQFGINESSNDLFKNEDNAPSEDFPSREITEILTTDNSDRDAVNSASSVRSGAQSRFVKDDVEGLIYEPGLPFVDKTHPAEYLAPTDAPHTADHDDSGLDERTESGSTGHASTTNDKHPLVFNKDRTAFEGSFGGPSLPAVASNQVMPVDQGTYQMAELRQQQQPPPQRSYRKQSIVYGANENTDGPGCCGWILYIFSVLLIIFTLPFSLIFTIKVVQEYERAVIFRLGRLPSGGAKGPGIFFIIPCIESYTKVDLRTVSFDVPPQEVLTKDSVTVSVDAVVYYQVSNPTVSVANVENAHHSTRLLAQTTLRNILGTKNMTEILSDRESISQGMQSTLDEATDSWGIKVERVEIKDVRLPVQLQRAMAAEAEAAREARAKVIAAEGEQKAARSLKEAADVMASSGAALQLRYLQTLNSISAEKNSTIIFPLPIDMLSSFMKK